MLILTLCAVLQVTLAVQDWHCTTQPDVTKYAALPASDFLVALRNTDVFRGCRLRVGLSRDACAHYVETSIGAWPPGGTGCAMKSKMDKGVSSCPHIAVVDYGLSAAEVNKFCTEDWEENAAAQVKSAMKRGLCDVHPVHVESDMFACRNISTCKCVPSATPGGISNLPVSVMQTSKIHLDRVTFCLPAAGTGPESNPSCITEEEFFFTRPEYAVFESDKWSRRRLSEVNIAITSGGGRPEIQHLAMSFAGQQFGYGDASSMTGQVGGWKMGWELTEMNTQADRNYIESIHHQVVHLGYISPWSTFFAAKVFDTQYNFDLTKAARDQLLKGYRKYIVSQIGSNMRTIYLVGHSRGGCLAARLATKLHKRFPRARLVLHLFDPVCNHRAGLRKNREFSISRTASGYRNPLVFKYKVKNVDIEKKFGNKDCVAIRLFLSGEEVNGIPGGRNVRAFGHKGFKGSGNEYDTIEHKGRIFLNQSWHADTHVSIMSDKLDLVREHFREAMRDFPNACYSGQ